MTDTELNTKARQAFLDTHPEYPDNWVDAVTKGWWDDHPSMEAIREQMLRERPEATDE